MVVHQTDGTVEFAYFRPGADSVSLAGDFNGWQSHAHPMHRDDEGWWRLHLALPPGEYRFKYVVDHCIWETDFAASPARRAGLCCLPGGSHNHPHDWISRTTESRTVARDSSASRPAVYRTICRSAVNMRLGRTLLGCRRPPD